MSPRAWAGRHAQTLVGSLGRIVRQPLGALMTMAVIAVALVLPLFLEVMLENARAATANLPQGFDVSVYLQKPTPSARTRALAEQLRARSDVASVHVVTADVALDEFRRSSGFGQALDALSDNPLPDTLIVTPTPAASTPEGSQRLQQVIAALPDVETVQADNEWVQRLSALLDLLRRVIELIGGLLGLGVLAVVGNTIRLDIMNRRSEIEVMKLVGATDSFARRPFLYSGIWYGLGGGAMSLIAVALAIHLVSGPVAHLASLYGSSFKLMGVRLKLGIGVLALAVALSWLGSWLAATRHIHEIEPT